jgi:hypothetical protein
MSLKNWGLQIIILVTFIIAIFCGYTCFNASKKHDTLLSEKPPLTKLLLEADSLDNKRREIWRKELLKDPENISTDAHIESAIINEKLDSILNSPEYKQDKIYLQEASLEFTKKENKLTLQYVFGVFGIILGISSLGWSSMKLYTRKKKREEP